MSSFPLTPLCTVLSQQSLKKTSVDFHGSSIYSFKIVNCCKNPRTDAERCRLTHLLHGTTLKVNSHPLAHVTFRGACACLLKTDTCCKNVRIKRRFSLTLFSKEESLKSLKQPRVRADFPASSVQSLKIMTCCNRDLTY